MGVTDLITRPYFIIKIVELVLSIVIAGLLSGYPIAALPNIYERMAVINGTVIGYIILGALIIIGYILDCPLNTKLILISSGAAFLLFITSGGLILDGYTRGVKFTQVLVGGILALANSLVYAGDAFLSWKFGS